MKELKNELDKTNKLINTHKSNLIYLLKNTNVEFINLINYHYTFNDLINKRDELERKIYFKKFE